MNIIKAAQDTLDKCVERRGRTEADDSILLHIDGMIMKMKDMPEAKANRWLGWIQGVVYAKGWLTLEEEKTINRQEDTE